MKQNELSPAKGSIKNRKRKGRGNAAGSGGECGRGHKGQKSRSGYSAKPGFEGGQMPLYKRVPKKRGFRNPFRTEYFPLNLSIIEAHYADSETVDPDSLIEKGLIKENALVKILGNGELSKKLTIKAHKISKSAQEKIEKAGAKFEQV